MMTTIRLQQAFDHLKSPDFGLMEIWEADSAAG